MKKWKLALAGSIAIGILCVAVTAARGGGPALSDSKKVEIISLQRDVNGLQAEMAAISANFTSCQQAMPVWQKEFGEKQKLVQEKADALNKMLDSAKVAGYSLDPKTLTYQKTEAAAEKK